MTQRFHTKLVGVTQKNRDGSARQEVLKACCVGDPLDLVTEPTNRFDPDALAVRRRGGQQVGYVPAELSGALTRLIEHGARAAAEVLRIEGGTAEEPTRTVAIRITVEQDVDSTVAMPLEQMKAGDLAPAAAYYHYLERALLDGVLSDAEKAKARTFKSHLEDEEVRAVHARVYCRALMEVAIDGVISEREEVRLSNLRVFLSELGWSP